MSEIVSSAVSSEKHSRAPGNGPDWPIVALLLLAGPFYLNDFASILVSDWRVWLAIDYVCVKLLPLAIVLWLIRGGQMAWADLGLTAQGKLRLFVAFAAVTLVGTLIDQNGYLLVERLPGYPALGGMPEITSRAWNGFDLTVGLLLVGVCEELVFRGFMSHFLRRYTDSPMAIVAISSAAFGLIHWSLGLHAVLVTAFIGAVFMLAYLFTRSLPAIMLAHFSVNFIDFAGVVPKSIFRLI